MKNGGFGVVEVVLILTVLFILILVFRPALISFVSDVVRSVKGGII